VLDDVTDDGDALAGVGLLTDDLVAKLTLDEEPLKESLVVVMTFSVVVVVVVVVVGVVGVGSSVDVVVVVVVVGLAVQNIQT